MANSGGLPTRLHPQIVKQPQINTAIDQRPGVRPQSVGTLVAKRPIVFGRNGMLQHGRPTRGLVLCAASRIGLFPHVVGGLLGYSLV
jgi:hypothetical protein